MRSFLFAMRWPVAALTYIPIAEIRFGYLAILMDRYSRRADNCYDNAFMESCFGTLKNELEIVKYTNLRIATNEISEYLNYYNVDRKHSSLNYLTPKQFKSIQLSLN